MQAVKVKSAAGRFSIRREVYKRNGQAGVSHRNNKIMLECVCVLCIKSLLRFNNFCLNVLTQKKKKPKEENRKKKLKINNKEEGLRLMQFDANK